MKPQLYMKQNHAVPLRTQITVRDFRVEYSAPPKSLWERNGEDVELQEYPCVFVCFSALSHMAGTLILPLLPSAFLMDHGQSKNRWWTYSVEAMGKY